jgi:uncharacterized protein YgbK (DUF1537 family)
LLGCIADDFTGASDAASFLMAGGLNTILFNGIPDGETMVREDTGAVVIALKTRTEETGRAVTESIAAAEWLKEQGAPQIYNKYCSTFDSTPTGNIGPICDALLDAWGGQYSLICPSLPVNKRTVSNGRLYVDGIPLDQSHMSRHPLTPMWDSSIPALMKGQSNYPCFILNRETLEGPDTQVRKLIAEYGRNHSRFYLVPDYVDDADADRIVSMFGDVPLLTGGSGILTALARKISAGREQKPFPSAVSGKALLAAGSCSPATIGQIRRYKEAGGTAFMLNAGSLAAGVQSVEILWNDIKKTSGESVLLYTAGNKDAGVKTEPGTPDAAVLLEQTMAALAEKAVAAGYRRIIVAGGETSGAVTRALGFNAYRIGSGIAPGVPVMQPLQNPDIRLVLKSGNFGQEDFFLRALNETGEA